MLIDFNYTMRLVAILIFILIAIYLKKKKLRSYTYILFFGVFYLYMMLLINFTQFPIITDLDPFYHSLSYAFNLIPINPFIDMNKAWILNVILTIPFGFLLPFLKKVNLKILLIYGFILTISIESVQLLVYLILGAHNRYIDINDIISNLIGVILGYFIFKGFCRTIVFLVDKYKIEMNFILKFICETAKFYGSEK